MQSTTVHKMCYQHNKRTIYALNEQIKISNTSSSNIVSTSRWNLIKQQAENKQNKRDKVRFQRNRNKLNPISIMGKVVEVVVGPIPPSSAGVTTSYEMT